MINNPIIIGNSYVLLDDDNKSFYINGNIELNTALDVLKIKLIESPPFNIKYYKVKKDDKYYYLSDVGNGFYKYISLNEMNNLLSTSGQNNNYFNYYLPSLTNVIYLTVGLIVGMKLSK